MVGLGMMAVGILTLIVTFTIIPIVGDQLDRAVTLPSGNSTTEVCDNGGTGCHWNASVNSHVTTGISVWEGVGGILKVGAIIVVVAGFLTTLKGLKG